MSANNGTNQHNKTTALPHKLTVVNSVLTSAAYGSVSSLSSSLILQPLDRLKTLSQQSFQPQASVYMNMRSVITNNGVLDLWRGLTPTLLRVIPGVALYFGSLELCQHSIHSNKHPHFRNFFIGFLCRSFAAAALMPATVIKTRFESNVFRDRSICLAARSIFKSDGLRGLFRGIVPTVLRDAPFSGIYLAFYRQNIQLWTSYFGNVSSPSRFFCGVVAGILACAVTQPFDITKTQMQLYPKKFGSSRQAIVSIYKQGGFPSFFNGFLLRAGRRTAMAALSWTIFDALWGTRAH